VPDDGRNSAVRGRFSFFFSFFCIPHSEFDIYYHYFCRLYNSGTLPFRSARVEQRSFGGPCASPSRYKCSRFRAQFEYCIKYINAIYYTVRTLHNARHYTTVVIILLYNNIYIVCDIRGKCLATLFGDNNNRTRLYNIGHFGKLLYAGDIIIIIIIIIFRMTYDRRRRK